MDTPQPIDILTTCEGGLRRAAADALTAGDYAAGRRITDWAQTVGAMLAEARDAAGLSSPANGQSSSVAAAGHSAAQARPAPQAKPAGRGVRGRHAPDEYPRFVRRGDELVKVGWSKKERREYQHRAPRRTIDAMAARLTTAGARGRVFTSEDLLPLTDPSDGQAFPPYQAYVALAWLRHLNLVVQHGRKGGYTLATGKQFDHTIAAAWSDLPGWRG